VVDFIGLPNFPVFNVADMSITFSAIAMIILAWRGVPLAGDEDAGHERQADERQADTA
jgi:signal peptidase II